MSSNEELREIRPNGFIRNKNESDLKEDASTEQQLSLDCLTVILKSGHELFCAALGVGLLLHLRRFLFVLNAS